MYASKMTQTAETLRLITVLRVLAIMRQMGLISNVVLEVVRWNLDSAERSVFIVPGLGPSPITSDQFSEY